MRDDNDTPIFTGPPLKLATRAELIEELCNRCDLPAMVYWMEESDLNNEGESNFLMRHSFGDKATLARALRVVADALEGGERENAIPPPIYRRE